jgi:endonuclease/exonuclease/phosphatase family metal-dependent hydrolase
MQITTVQWNIGGGRVRTIDGAVDLLASYSKDGLAEVIELLKINKPDIITLQEIHADSNSNQAENIADALGLQYVVSDFYADSHIEAGQRLGQAILSRYPITNHDLELFLNPHYEAIWEDGSKALSHDKGVTSCIVDIDGIKLDVKTLHLIPFRRFNVDPQSKEAELVLEDIVNKLRSDSPNQLIQGDFNLDFSSLKGILPTLMQNMDEVVQNLPTNPKGRKLDHVVFRGLSLESSSSIDSVLTDHYPVITKFMLNT